MPIVPSHLYFLDLSERKETREDDEEEEEEIYMYIKNVYKLTDYSMNRVGVYLHREKLAKQKSRGERGKVVVEERERERDRQRE